MRFPDEALGCRTDLGRSGLRPVRCQVVSDVAALPAAQPKPLGADSRYGCRRGLRPWQFSLTSQSDVNAAPSDETSRPARRVSPGTASRTGFAPVQRTRADSLFADVWRDCAVPGLISTRGRSLGR